MKTVVLVWLMSMVGCGTPEPLCSGACDAISQCHLSGECDETTGECSTPVALYGTPCELESALPGICSDGECIEVPPCDGVDCSAIDECHLDGECDPQTGTCSTPTAPDGTPCDDGDSATENDACEAGVCVGEPVVDLCDGVTCTAIDECHLDGECDPDTGACSTPVAPDGTLCSDGDPNTVLDSCLNGVCIGIDLCAGVVCGPATDCRDVETCDPLSGICLPGTPVLDGTVCDDGNVLTFDDECLAGECEGTTSCAGIPDTTPCDDGNPQTSYDTCSAGTCLGVELCSGVVCVSAGPCYEVGTCDLGTGNCSSPVSPDGTPCDDGDPSTTSSSCFAGSCEDDSLCAGVQCAAATECLEAEACDPSSGQCAQAAAVADGTVCDDGDPTTTSSSCFGGVCVDDSLCSNVTCVSNDPCIEDGVCDPSTGTCVQPPAADGTLCVNGGQWSTCLAGTCR